MKIFLNILQFDYITKVIFLFLHFLSFILNNNSVQKQLLRNFENVSLFFNLQLNLFLFDNSQ